MLNFRCVCVLLLLMSARAPAQDAAGQSVDFVLVKKSEAKLYLMRRGEPVATFHIALGGNPVGHKQRQGDGRTPEGRYALDARNEHSAFYKSLHVSYPNTRDREQARRNGVPVGGDIMIHGQPNGWAQFEAATQARNWTLGCIALTNEDMDVVWSSVPIGTPIEIDP
jgi:murein L,D-transpeptidase YafK